MPANSTLEQQAADIGATLLANAANGQINANNIKILTEGMAAGLVLLATAINNLRTAQSTINGLAGVGASTAQQNAWSNATTPAGTNGAFTPATTALPSNFVGPTGGSDPVAFSAINAGTTVISTQQP